MINRKDTFGAAMLIVSSGQRISSGNRSIHLEYDNKDKRRYYVKAGSETFVFSDVEAAVYAYMR